MRGRCKGHVTSTALSLSLLALSVQKVNLQLTYIKSYRRESRKLHRGTVLKFLNSIIKLLCEISKELGARLLQEVDGRI